MQLFTRTVGSIAIPPGPFVLIVDDEVASVGPLGELVKLAGYPNVAAGSAYDALACCVLRKPSVVVTDLVMPGRDGRDLARRIKRRYPTVPILLVTGQDLDKPDWAIPEGMFQAVFTKPLNFDRFLGTLGGLMPSVKRKGHDRPRP